MSDLPSPCRPWPRLAACAVLLLATGAPQAHDTWFQRLPEAQPQRPAHILGTGNLFPTYDSRNAAEHLVKSGCRAGGVTRAPLVEAPAADGGATEAASEHLRLVPAQDLPRAGRISCWAQQKPFEIEFGDDLVELYFKEAMPPAAVRQAWTAQKSRGQPWQERYVKHARVEWFPDPDAVEPEPPAPSGMELDALLLSPLRAPRVGEELEFLITKNGQPMTNFSVEFRHHASRFGLWRRTDENGRVRLRAPSAGRWLLRGIELTPPPQDRPQDRWLGLFIALSFDALPAR